MSIKNIKKNYKAPEIEITKLEETDIIQTSTDGLLFFGLFAGSEIFENIKRATNEIINN